MSANAMTIKAPPVAKTGNPPVNLSSWDPVSKAFFELTGELPPTMKEVK